MRVKYNKKVAYYDYDNKKVIVIKNSYVIAEKRLANPTPAKLKDFLKQTGNKPDYKLTQKMIERILDLCNRVLIINYRNYSIFYTGGDDECYGYESRTINHAGQYLINVYPCKYSGYWELEDLGRTWGFYEEDVKPYLDKLKLRNELEKKLERLGK